MSLFDKPEVQTIHRDRKIATAYWMSGFFWGLCSGALAVIVVAFQR